MYADSAVVSIIAQESVKKPKEKSAAGSDRGSVDPSIVFPLVAVTVTAITEAAFIEILRTSASFSYPAGIKSAQGFVTHTTIILSLPVYIIQNATALI